MKKRSEYPREIKNEFDKINKLNRDLTGILLENPIQMFSLNMPDCPRYGQSLSYDSPLPITDSNSQINIVQIGDLVENMDISGVDVLSLNKKTGKYEWKPVNAVYKHKNASKIIRTQLHDGRYVDTTSDHNLFNFDENANIVEVKPSEKLDTIITAKEIRIKPVDVDLSDDELWLIGVAIGDGNLAANNGKKDSSLRFSINKDDLDVQKRIESIINTFSDAKFINNGKGISKISLPTEGMPNLIMEIGHGSSNKKNSRKIIKFTCKPT